LTNKADVEGEQATLTAATVRELIYVATFWDVVRLLFVVPFVATNPKGALVFTLAKLATVEGIPYWLLCTGRVRTAAWMLAISATSVAAVYVVFSGGIRSSALSIEVTLIGTAAIFLGQRGATRLGLASLFFLSVVAAFQGLGGQLPDLFMPSPWLAYLNVLSAATLAFVPVRRALERNGRLVQERLKMAEEIRRSKARLDDMVQAVDGIVWECDAHTWRFTFVSKRAERLLGYPVQKWLDDDGFWAAHIHPDDRAWVVDYCKEASAWGQGHTFEYRMIAADRRVVWLRDVVTVSRQNEMPMLLRGIMIDVTERKGVEAERQETLAQVRELSAHVEEAREEERTRIAREIHDELGQRLTALKMQIACLEQTIDPTNVSGKTEVAATTRQVESMIRTVRQIASDLRPGVLDVLGLSAALDWLVKDFQDKHGISCTTTLEPCSANPKTSTTVFRVVQEALTNVEKHAKATEVWLTVAIRNDTLEVILRDNGCGLSEQDRHKPGSFGILGMRERALLGGGTLEVLPRAIGGTEVHLTIPIEETH
jgi:PAS domain S-box-containing protein